MFDVRRPPVIHIGRTGSVFATPTTRRGVPRSDQVSEGSRDTPSQPGQRSSTRREKSATGSNEYACRTAQPSWRLPEKAPIRFRRSSTSGRNSCPAASKVGKLVTNAKVFQSQPAVRQRCALSGSGFSGLSLADVNCDGQADFIYNLTDPAEIRVLFGNGMGGVISDVPLAYADQGTPRGGLGIARFDGDETPDIFTAADPGDGQMDARVRVLASQAE